MRDFLISTWNLIRDIDKIALIFVLVTFTKAVGFLPSMPDVISYGAMILLAGWHLLKTEFFDNKMMLLIGYLALNVLICDPPSVFNSWMRLGLFIILLLCVSPILQSDELCYTRRQMLYLTLNIVTILSVISFFCWFLGINFMVRETLAEYNTAGYFGGLFRHSMILGPCSGISCVFMAYKAYHCRERIQRLLYMVAALACLGSVFFSASRSALVCSLAGIAIMLYKASGGTGRFMRMAAIITIAAAVTFPLWGSATEKMIEKNEANIEQFGKMSGSRDDKWGDRIQEFKTSPLCGIGFSTVDVTSDAFGANGVVEPGTSWLAVFSMTGIIGGLLFAWIFFSAFAGCYGMWRDEDALYIGLLTLFSVHMLAEGYVFAAGSFLCVVLWLVIGCCYDRWFE